MSIGEGKGRGRRSWGAAVLLVASALLSASPAVYGADPDPATFHRHFEPTLQMQADPPLAGSPARLTIRLGLPADNDLDHQIKETVLSMEPGRFPDPHVPYCTEAQLEEYREAINAWALAPTGDLPHPCPRSRVGTLVGWGSTTPGADPFNHAYGPVYGDVVNAEPISGYQGRLLIVLIAVIRGVTLPAAIPQPKVMDSPHIIPIDAMVRESDDFGIDAYVRRMPDRLFTEPTSENFPLLFRLTSAEITLDGTIGVDHANPENNHPFMSNPTTCGDHRIAGIATSYAGETKPIAATVPVTGCRRMDFSPELEVAYNPPLPETTAELTTTIRQSPLGEAHIKSTKVTLPLGLNVGTAVQPCSREAAAALACPDTSKIGAVTANAQALFEPLTGPVYIVAPDQNDNFGMLISLHGLVNVNVMGTVHLNLADRSLTTEIDNMPQLPVTELKLTVFGGQNGILKTPKCGAYKIKARFESHSGMLHASDSDLALPCKPAAPQPVKPAFAVKLTKAGNLRVQVKARGGTSLSKVSASLKKLLKPGVLKSKGARGRLLEQVRRVSPRNARLRLGATGTLGVGPQSSVPQVSFEVPGRYLAHARSCKAKERVSVKAILDDGSDYRQAKALRTTRGSCAKGRRTR